MPDANDMDLLQEFARHNSEAAFAALVQRHLNLVYSVALRFTANPGDAQDVAQAVFIILARKAARLNERTVLTGWLYETTRLTAAGWLRTQKRRQAREQEAYMQSTLDQAGTDNLWRQLAPHLEAAMSRLNARERTLLALRFYENKTGAEAAALLGIREEAAHKRTARALEKLRKIFTKRGVSSTTAILAGAISAHSVQAAPVGLAKGVTAIAIVKGAAASTSTLTLIKGALKIMAWTKMKTAIVVGLGVLLAAGTTTVVVKESNVFKVNKSSGIDAYISDSNMQTFLAAPPIMAVQTTHFPKYSGTTARFVGSKIAGRDQTLQSLIAIAYDFRTPRIIFPPNMPTNHYDFLCTVANNPHEKFQAEIAKTLGYTAQVETRAVDCQLLKVADAGGGKLKAGDSSQPVPLDHRIAFNYPNHPISALANALEIRFRMPVIDQTGLAGNYNMVVDWRWQGAWNGKDRETNLNSLKKVILDRFGLELIFTNMPVKMLVVEKVN
jgi:uncharacterized protein (TIGR03435 family)